MKKSICISLISLLLLNIGIYGQVTEPEKQLRSQNADTTQGWKTGGVLSVNMAQTSLSHWAAVVRIHLLLTGSSVPLPTIKKETLYGTTPSTLVMAC